LHLSTVGINGQYTHLQHTYSTESCLLITHAPIVARAKRVVVI
jgi:hypothetical protein